MAPAREDVADCIHQLLRQVHFCDVAGGPGPKAWRSKLFFRVIAHDQNAHLRVRSLDFGKYIQSVAIRHAKVQQHNVPRLTVSPLEDLPRTFRLADDSVRESLL